VFPEARKGERASVFHGDCERQLRFSRFAPFVEAVRWDQATPFLESLPIRGCRINRLDPRIDRFVRNFRVFRPVRYQSALKRVEGALLRFGIESDRQNLLARGDIVTDG
jgi:hypothetical protein